MNRTGIIVAVESYLLRKGMVTILNRIPGVTEIREFESVPPLEKFINTRKRDLMVISQSLFDHSYHILFNEGDLQERTIILTQGLGGEPGSGLPTIDMGDSKEIIMK